MKIVYFILLIVLLSTYCAAEYCTERDKGRRCDKTRYPVAGIFRNGRIRKYDNNCDACRDDAESWHRLTRCMSSSLNRCSRDRVCAWVRNEWRDYKNDCDACSRREWQNVDYFSGPCRQRNDRRDDDRRDWGSDDDRRGGRN